MENKQNFQNEAFAAIFEWITANMPALTFLGIIFIYSVTAALNVFFIPLPWYISTLAAIAIQFGRFSVVFMDFLNPTGKRSVWPPIVASVATVVAVVELAYSIQGRFVGSEFWAIFLFGAMLISFGYLLEINFIAKGAEAFGMSAAKKRRIGALSPIVGRNKPAPEMRWSGPPHKIPGGNEPFTAPDYPGELNDLLNLTGQINGIEKNV